MLIPGCAKPHGGSASVGGRYLYVGFRAMDQDVWTCHLARYDYSLYLPDGPELSSCAPLSELNFHLREEWIPLEFTGAD
jgi:hypothetical protein